MLRNQTHSRKWNIIMHIYYPSLGPNRRKNETPLTEVSNDIQSSPAIKRKVRS